MQKHTIYSYLQRSLVKILSKSSYRNEYKTTLVKPLNTCCKGIAGSAKPIKNSNKLVPLATEVALQSQSFNFSRKVNSSFMPFLSALGNVGQQPSLSFSCKFDLISFRRPRFGVLILKCNRSLLFNFANQKKSQATKQKIIKLNQSLNNYQLLDSFRAKLLGTHFYPRTLCYNKKIVACSLCLLWFRCPSCSFWWSSWCPSCKKGTKQTTKKSKKRTFFRQSRDIGRLKQGVLSLREAPKKEALLLTESFEQSVFKAATNFDFYIKQSKFLFLQSFYKRTDKSKYYRKIFHNLFYFFSFFSFTRNKELSFFNSAELAAAKQVNFTRYAQQVLYLEKRYGLTCCVQIFFLNGISVEYYDTLEFFRNKTTIYGGCPKLSFTAKSNQMECFSLRLLCFLTIIFYVTIKYIKQVKKQVDNPFQAVLIKNNSIYQFTKTIELNFISFKPFSRKLVGTCSKGALQLQSKPCASAFNSPYFFLMRPLFSLTRLDTFFICESLKLPIYPDKSNLRVDFLRNRIRKQILPAIRILLNPQFDTILCRFYE